MEWQMDGSPKETQTVIDSTSPQWSRGPLITCNCGPNPMTITLTIEKLIGFATTIDGGGLITLSGNYANRIFETAVGGMGPGTLELKNITLERGYARAGRSSRYWMGQAGETGWNGHRVIPGPDRASRQTGGSSDAH